MSTIAAQRTRPSGHGSRSRFGRYKYLYILSLPAIVLLVVFKYAPMLGLIIAFKEFSLYRGILGSKWAGLENFARFFSSAYFLNILRNTLAINLLSLVLFFPAPIIVALLLNEVRHNGFKRVVQTVTYIPHFISWVVVYALTFYMFSGSQGLVNKLLPVLGYDQVNVLGEPSLFWLLLTAQTIWRETGWGTIIFLASLAGVDLQLYEACRMDGGNRWRQLWHITLPGIRHVIITLLILRMGHIIDASFEQVYLMQNAAVAEVSEVFDTFVYRVGIQQGQFGFAAAAGMFKSLVGLVFVFGTNRLAKSFGQEGIM